MTSQEIEKMVAKRWVATQCPLEIVYDATFVSDSLPPGTWDVPLTLVRDHSIYGPRTGGDESPCIYVLLYVLV